MHLYDDLHSWEMTFTSDCGMICTPEHLHTCVMEKKVPQLYIVQDQGHVIRLRQRGWENCAVYTKVNKQKGSDDSVQSVSYLGVRVQD